MLIKKIRLDNFRTITAEAELGKINTLLAPNGSGKTSFIDAVRYAITGTAPENGFGPGKNTVEITLGDGTCVERSFEKTTSCKINGKKTSAKAANEVIESITGVPTDHAKAVVTSEIFNMGPEDFQEFLLKYTPEKPNADIVKSYFTGMTADAEAELDLIMPPMPERFPLSVIDDCCTYATEHKKDLRKNISELKSAVKMITAETPLRTIDEIEKELMDAIAAEKNAENAKKAAGIYESAVRMREKLEKQCRELEEAVKNNPANPVSPDRIRDNRNGKAMAAKNIKAMQRTLGTLKNNIDLFENVMKGMESRICPFSGHLKTEIVCTADMDAHRDRIRQLIDENRKLADETAEKIREEEKRAAEYDSEYESLVRAVNAYEVKKSDSKRLLSLQNELKNTHIPEKPPVADVNAADIRLEIQRLKREKKNAEDYAKVKQAQKDIDMMTEHMKVYDLIATAFSPKGEVMSSIVTHYLNAFEDAANEIAKLHGMDFMVKFKQDTGVRIFVERQGKEIPYEQLSTGEKLSVAFLIIDMLNQLTGLNLMVLDNIECLDHDALNQLVALLKDKTVTDRYDHIFIAAVDHADVEDALKDFQRISL